MIKVKTPIDQLFNFIEDHSPVRESKIPKQLKSLQAFDNHIRVLESNGMIEVKSPLFSSNRIFVFKSRERTTARDSWNLGGLSF
ncbi:MAG: hypothetical protein V1678_02610 [Candidatus Aenigmatarchaeota archaeon]